MHLSCMDIMWVSKPHYSFALPILIFYVPGVQCETLCPRGSYGDECQSECKCLSDSSCNQRTGNCTCSRGFEGDHCELPCKPGSYGFGCKEKCTERHTEGMYETLIKSLISLIVFFFFVENFSNVSWLK